MEEEKTLKQLNDEYRKLVSETSGYREQLKTLSGLQDTAAKSLEEAEDNVKTSKDAYEDVKNAYELLKDNKNIDQSLREAFEKNMQEKQAALEKANAEKAESETQYKKCTSEVAKLQEDAKKANDRMNLILVSFSVDKTIHQALVNELEIDYEDTKEEKKDEQRKLDEIKTKISENSSIKESVSQLAELLEKFKKVASAITIENSQDLADLGNEIKNKRNSIRRKMRTLGIKGGVIKAEEIDAMTEQKDDQGRFVIAELDRQIGALDNEMAVLEEEKNSIINSMNIAVEMSEDLENGSKEYQELLSKQLELQNEVSGAKKQKANSEKRINEISGQKEQIEKELEGLKTQNSNADEIARLEKELEEINNEDIPLIDNPKIEFLNQKIQELKNKKSNNTAKVETEEYKKAKKEFDNAKLELDWEKNNPSVDENLLDPFTFPRNLKDGDIIVENPAYSAIAGELVKLRSEKTEIMNRYPELQKCNQDCDDASKAYERAKEVYSWSVNEYDEARKKVSVFDIDESTYPGIDTKLDPSVFQAYEDAEFEVRKAMIALQKKPADDTKNTYIEAIQKYKEAERNFRDALASINGGIEPNSKAMHDYLMLKLKSRYENEEGIPEEYNLEECENRIRIVEKFGKIDLGDLRGASGNLTNLMQEALLGDVNVDDLNMAIISYEQELNNIDSDEVRNLIAGETSVPVATKKGFLSKISGLFKPRMPEPKYDYAFDVDKKYSPEEANAIEDFHYASLERDNAKEDLEHSVNVENACNEAYYQEFNELSVGDQKKLVDFSNRALELSSKLQNTPKKINETALNRLQKALDDANAKLNSIQKTDDIDKQIQSLKDQLEKEPEKIESPSQKISKFNRARKKQEEINNLGTGTNTTRINELQESLKTLEIEESAEKQKVSAMDAIISEKVPKLEGLQNRISILALAKEKFAGIKNLIHIKDARKMQSRNSGPIANDLANATKRKMDDGGERY